MRGLTFELRRDQRQDARPGPVKMYAYHRPGPGGLPLGLASNEGLGLSRTSCFVFGIVTREDSLELLVVHSEKFKA